MEKRKKTVKAGDVIIFMDTFLPSLICLLVMARPENQCDGVNTEADGRWKD
jgi:hypothetical protein